MADEKSIVPLERIETWIYLVRGQRVKLSTHLSELYGVEPRVLVQAVKRNLERFPEDFIWQLTEEEYRSWERAFDEHGLPGLRTTRVRRYRPRPRPRSGR